VGTPETDTDTRADTDTDTKGIAVETPTQISAYTAKNSMLRAAIFKKNHNTGSKGIILKLEVSYRTSNITN